VNTVEGLRGRLVSVTEGKLEQLRTTEEFDIGEFRTFVDVQVICEGCNGQFDIIDLLERGGCDCAESTRG
jgi:hypothetical protein